MGRQPLPFLPELCRKVACTVLDSLLFQPFFQRAIFGGSVVPFQINDREFYELPNERR
jgi:hypothetical protein